ncbi:MAG: alpha/beta fold hydrolase [Micrococcaceae bacterium]
MTAEVELAATPLEAALADAWGAVLGIEPISRHDRFVELGGTSLAAEKVLVLLRRRLAVDLGAEVLVGQPTLAEIAARIETAQRTRFTHRTPAHRRLTNPEPTTSTVHCFAGAGAGSVSFLGLASMADPCCAVIAYQAHGLESRGVPSWTVRMHARRHLKSLLREQPEGPYTLLGHSFGGHIAAAIAQLLTEQGKTVERLLLLDTVLKDIDSASVADYRQTNDVASSPPLSQRLRTHLRVAAAGIVRYSPPVQQATFWEQGIRVQNRHRPAPLPPYASVLISDENAEQAERWASGLAAPGQVQPIPGTHLSVLSDPTALAQVWAALAPAEPSRSKDLP